MIITPPKWHERAACQYTDPDSYFPEHNASTEYAKRVCRSCPVRAECLSFAFANGEKWGVWGGLDENERRQMTRKNMQEAA